MSHMFVYGWPHPDGSGVSPLMSILNCHDLLGRIVLPPMDENEKRKRATITNHVHTLDQTQISRGDQLLFNLKVDGEQLDDLIS